MLPKKANALIMGGTPSASILGLKNTSNIPINPATENGNLATLAEKDFATETTLTSIKNTDGIKKITDPLPTGTNTIGSVNLNDIHIILKSMLNVLANPSYVDKSANAIRNQAQSGTVTTVSTVTSVTGMTNIDSYQGKILMIGQNISAWANTVRSRIS
jgi:hypothetical protein